MAEKPMTKAETKRLVAELRREAARITTVLTPTPAWIVRQLGHDPDSKEYRQSEVASRDLVIRDALNNIDGISAQLREGWGA